MSVEYPSFERLKEWSAEDGSESSHCDHINVGCCERCDDVAREPVSVEIRTEIGSFDDKAGNAAGVRDVDDATCAVD